MELVLPVNGDNSKSLTYLYCDPITILLPYIIFFCYSGGQPSSSANAGDPPRLELPFNAHALPTPEALSIVLRRAQQLLNAHAVPALSVIPLLIQPFGHVFMTWCDRLSHQYIVSELEFLFRKC